MMKNVMIFFLTLSLMFGTVSCNDEECKKALADLVSEITTSTIATAVAGTPFAITALVSNTITTIETCTNDEDPGDASAGESRTGLNVDFDASGDQSFSMNIDEGVFNTPALNNGEAEEGSFSIEFNEPGDYRIISFADINDDVFESNEDNNMSDPSIQGKVSSSQSSFIIRVLPNPNYKRKANEPYAKILGKVSSRIIKL